MSIDIYDTAPPLHFEERMVLTRQVGERHAFVSASPYNTRVTKARAKRRTRRAARTAMRDPRNW